MQVPARLNPVQEDFFTVADSIIGQQPSNLVAGIQRSRFRKLFEGGTPEPLQLLQKDDQSLRCCGFSRSKIRYVRFFAEAVVSGRPDFEELHRMEDENVVRLLTELPGVRLWTGQMYLIFALNRLDVLPLENAAAASAFGELYGLPSKGCKDQARKVAETWRPWRTVGCWYLWMHQGCKE